MGQLVMLHAAQAAPVDQLVDRLVGAGIEPLEDPRGFSRGSAANALEQLEPYLENEPDPTHPVHIASRLLAMIVVANGSRPQPPPQAPAPIR